MIFINIMAFLVISILAFGIILFFSPKLRSKILGKDIKAIKDMVSNHKEDIRSINNDIAEVSQEATKIRFRAIKEGLTDNSTIYCKHCGEEIPADSKFCKHCGKEQ